MTGAVVAKLGGPRGSPKLDQSLLPVEVKEYEPRLCRRCVHYSEALRCCTKLMRTITHPVSACSEFEPKTLKEESPRGGDGAEKAQQV